MERALDRSLLYSAALDLAEQIDGTLSLLPGAAAEDRTVEGCDILDQPGTICIGGPGSNRYVADYPLLIDVGGDDVHANAAGGADPGLETAGNGLSVSVTLDLAGDDSYATAVPSADGSHVVQGAATAGGIGILVDAAGDDEYAATAAAPEGSLDGFALGQGYGASGVGILADFEGDDRYALSDPKLDLNHDGGALAMALGLGAGSVGGLGVALDAGTGSDVALVEARPQAALEVGSERLLSGGPALAGGYGLGNLGAVGIFADGGGADVSELRAATAPIAADERQPLAGIIAFQAVPQGFGNGAAGVGLALSGPGPTVRTVTSEVNGPRSFVATAWAIGYGLLGGYGGVYDAGGDDAYVIEATLTSEAHSEAANGCACAEATAFADGGAALTDVLGYSFFGGTGVLHDAAGNDRYVSQARVRVSAIAHDAREDPPPGSRVSAWAKSGGAGSASHGFGLAGGQGILFDESGDDEYRSVTDLSVSASASSAASIPASARATGGGAASYSMASSALGGAGWLRDGGGTDRYVATNSVSAEAVPPTQVAPGNPLARSQGSSGGGASWFADLDAGDTDLFTSVPENPACFGTRGSGVWRDCYSDSAGGVAA